MEDKLYKWILQEQDDSDQLLTRHQIKQKAKELSTLRGFKASKGWLDKFRRRYNVEVRPAVSESQFDDSEASQEKFEMSHAGEVSDPDKENDMEFDDKSLKEEESAKGDEAEEEEIYHYPSNDMQEEKRLLFQELRDAPTSSR